MWRPPRAQQGRTFASHEQLAADPWVHELIGREVAQVNAKLAQYETIKRFALLDHDFTFDGGQLTYTLKLKRRVIDERYAKVIEGLYAEAQAASWRRLRSAGFSRCICAEQMLAA